MPTQPRIVVGYLGDIDEMFRKAQTGEVVVGKEKVWSLAYADDLVIVAKKREEMKTMIKSFEKYVQKKELEVNVEKKMVVFGKKVRKEKEEWAYRGKKIEQVKEFQYLNIT